MSTTTINTHYGKNIKWTVYRNGYNAFVGTLTLDGSAYDISSRVFTAYIRTPQGSENKLTLTEGNGITNGGATGLLTIALTEAQLATLPRDRYFMVVEYTISSKDYPLLQGYIETSSETNPGTTTTSATIPVSIDGTTVSMAVTLAGGGVSSEDLALKANIASPTFTGTPAAPTAAAGTSTTQIATTAFVAAAILGLATLASPTFTGTPLVPTASQGTNTTQAASTAYVQGNAMCKATSIVDPLSTSYQAMQNTVGPDANNKPLEILNIGYTGHGATDDIHQNTTAIIRINGRLQIVRNIEWDPVNVKWLTPLQSASAYGSCMVEMGGEAVILHATPSGVNFSDVPHEILLASANGTDGPTAEKVTSGYFVQIKAPLFARFDSAAYSVANTNNTWNDTTGTHPLCWLSTGEAKGTETELMRIEGNNASPGLYFARSNGTLASRTIASANASAGKVAWKFYDGSDFETTSQIDAVSNSSVSANNMGSRIRFLTSPDTTANLTERACISSAGYFGIGVSMSAPTALIHISAGTTARPQMRFNDGVEPTNKNDGDFWREGSELKVHIGSTTYNLTKAAA